MPGGFSSNIQRGCQPLSTPQDPRFPLKRLEGGETLTRRTDLIFKVNRTPVERANYKQVDRFYATVIEGREYVQDVTTKYQKRFVRYRESLFRFLDENVIPWNNNTAERAIRHLAVQRNICGALYRRGAVDYLELLGIAQTCRFQGKSFLKFLLSEEIDADRFQFARRIKISKQISREPTL